MLSLKHNSTRLLLAITLTLTLLAQAQKTALAANGPFITKTVEGKFDEVYLGLKDVITGRGINIAHTLAAAAMLNRTGPAFGIKKNVYLSAETVEFCSAKISHELAAQNPQNVVLCPFTISVYVLTSDPKNVHLTYRVPVGGKGSEQVVGKIVKLIESIIKEATEW